MGVNGLFWPHRAPQTLLISVQALDPSNVVAIETGSYPAVVTIVKAGKILEAILDKGKDIERIPPCPLNLHDGWHVTYTNNAPARQC